MATEAQIQNIIKNIAPYCQKYAKKYGYKVCSPAIAQALQESLGKYDGLSLLAYKYNNYHGIKNYPKWTGKTVNLKTGEEYTKGTITTVTSGFCVFDSVPDAMENYYLFLERNPRYKALKSCITPEHYLYTIKNCGYCTSSTYVQNCIAKISKYNLKAYDSLQVTTGEYKVGQIYTLRANLYIREEPYGNKIKHTCITNNAKQNAYFDAYGNAILRQGTRVTCKEIKKTDTGTIWLLIPSGWICAKEQGKTYIL